MTRLLEGRNVLITGVASTDSIATATAAAAIAHGARVVVTALPRDLERARAACAELPSDETIEPLPFDITDVDAVGELREHLRTTVGHLDGALHAIAFAPRPALASIGGVPSAALEVAVRTSVHSYAVLGELLAALAPERGASLVGLDFDASRAWPTYNWMGVCKAALESTNRYLARRPRRAAHPDEPDRRRPADDPGGLSHRGLRPAPARVGRRAVAMGRR